MIRTMFAEAQSFKGVENYFTDSLLYQETSKITNEPLPYDIDSDNDWNSESEEDITTTLAMEPLVAYMNNPYYNNVAENEGE